MLYACAAAVAAVRRQVRAALMMQAWSAALSTEPAQLSLERLRIIFDRYDTSGDGYLDADELKIALRLSIGRDVSSADCDATILATDRNGDCLLSFDEFLGAFEMATGIAISRSDANTSDASLLP